MSLEEAVAQYTLTINVVEPAGTTIRMKVNDGNWSVQSYVTANSGSKIEWEVSKTGYVTQSDIVLLDQTQTIPVTLVEESPKVTLTVTATPEGSTITIDGVETNTAEVTIGESATVVVAKEGYITYSQAVEVTEATNLSVNLMQRNIKLHFTSLFYRSANAPFLSAQCNSIFASFVYLLRKNLAYSFYIIAVLIRYFWVLYILYVYIALH